MAKKQGNGYVLPPVVSDKRKCIKIYIPNDVYDRGAFWGALYELTYAWNWQQNPPEKARELANLWMQIWTDAYERSNGMECCGDEAIIKRVNPSTGQIEQSKDGGTTWQAEAGGLSSIIVNPVPPVTSGVAATKCDAATNVKEQVQGWITQVTNDFDTASSLLEFAEAVVLAIAGAVLTIITGGGFSPVEALIIASLGAALAAAWGAGKAAFTAYWTSANVDIVFCAAVCNIGDDGSFTDAQFSAFWNDCNDQLPANAAKMLFMGFLSSVSTSGLNAMAASGKSADGDCSDCDCGTCEVIWAKGNIDGNTAFGTVTSMGAGLYRVQSQLHTDGVYYAEMLTPAENQCCHVVSIVANAGGNLPATGTAASRIVCPLPQHVGNVTFGDMITSDTNFNYIAWNSGTAFDILIQFD